MARAASFLSTCCAPRGFVLFSFLKHKSIGKFAQKNASNVGGVCKENIQ